MVPGDHDRWLGLGPLPPRGDPQRARLRGPPGRLAGVLEPRGRRAPPLFILWRTSGNGARRLRPDVLGGVAACELDERPAALRRGGNLTGRRACQLGGIWAHRRGATAPGPASSPGRQTLARSEERR